MTDAQRRTRLRKIIRLACDRWPPGPAPAPREIELEALSWRQNATSSWFAQRRGNFGRPFWTGRW